MKVMPFPEIVEEVCTRLVSYQPYVKSFSNSSVYVYFAALPHGLTHKMRISNHNERKRYGFKWQLRLDGISDRIDFKPASRYYDRVDKLVLAFTQYYRTYTPKDYV